MRESGYGHGVADLQQWGDVKHITTFRWHGFFGRLSSTRFQKVHFRAISHCRDQFAHPVPW